MNILITGVSRGIGYELVKYFAGDGHQVIGISRNQEKLSLLEEEYENFKGLAIDLCQPDFSDLDVHLKKWNRVDVVINNAGALVNKEFTDWSRDDVQRVYGVNVMGPFFLLQHLFPYLKKAGSAHVVNVSSMGGFQGSAKFPGLSGYSSSKAAIASLSECLAEEWKADGISVNALALGAVQTEMLAQAFPDYQAPTSAEEMAHYIFSFALEGHKYFNGKVLPVSASTP